MMRWNRQCSQHVTRWLAQWPVTPNQVTILNLGIGIGAITAFSRGSWWSMVLGACCLELSYILDNCDGELARLRHSVSALGRWLDTFVDTVIHVSLFPAIGVGLVRNGAAQPALAIAGWCGAAATLLIYLITMVQESRPARARSDDGPGILPGWHDWKDIARADYALLVLLCAVVGWLPGLLWVSIAGVVMLCAAVLVHVFRGGRIV